MITKTIRRIVAEMRQQPVITAVSIFGTAFAVFLVMVVMMISAVKVTPFAPESNRSNFYFGRFFNYESTPESGESGNSSAGLTLDLARRLYGSLEGVDTISVMTERFGSTTDVTAHDGIYNLNYNLADGAFWKIFDHTFVAGRPYSDGAVESGIAEVVLSETKAREMFGLSPEEVIGKTLIMAEKEATVVGVVADHSPLASYAYGDIFGPYSAFPALAKDYNNWLGSYLVMILAKPGTKAEDLKSQVRERYRRLEPEMKSEKIRPVYHGAPQTLEEAVDSLCSNCDVNNEGAKQRLLIYLMLILIPAINLSSITQSSLRKRTSEFGVRRAFGATRSRIFATVLAENFIVTLIGAVIGFIAAILVTWATADILFHLSDFGNNTNSFSPFMLISWSTVSFAVLLAMVLNLFSTSIPALRAAFLNPVNAISGHSAK